MKFEILLQPHNQFGQFLQLRTSKLIGVISLFVALLFVYPSFYSWQQYQAWQKQEAQLQQTKAELQHQQRLLQSLIKKQQQQLLTPQVASQIAQINQQVQQSKYSLPQLASQWLFEQQPRLQLHMEGRFSDLVTFINQLLQQQSLHLLDLHIEKSTEQPSFISSQLLFQLNPQINPQESE